MAIPGLINPEKSLSCMSNLSGTGRNDLSVEHFYRQHARRSLTFVVKMDGVTQLMVL